MPRTTGYVAIDDVKLLNGACQSPLVCDFEEPSICGYQNDATANFAWSRHRGSTSSSTTGATNGRVSLSISHSFLFSRLKDHTYGTGLGYYMYIETSYPQKPGDKARLISPVYNVAPGGSCLQFFYHMWGDSTGSLNIFLKTTAGIQSSPLWALSRDQGDLWRTGRAAIQAANKFQVRIFPF